MAENEEVVSEETVVVIEQPAEVVTEAKTEAPADKKGRNDRRNGKFDRKNSKPRKEQSEFEQIMVDIRSVQKTVKGGRVQSFSALCVVGNRKGKVGIGMGKAREATNAIEKGFNAAKKNIIEVPMNGSTIPHAVNMKYSACRVILLPSKEGTGVIAGGAARPVLELSGIKDITAKNQGSSNKINTVKATFNALKSLRTKEEVAKLRGKTVEEL